MIYTLENHELKHAVEEMLFHLLPTETLSKADTAEQVQSAGTFLTAVETYLRTKY